MDSLIKVIRKIVSEEFEGEFDRSLDILPNKLIQMSYHEYDHFSFGKVGGPQPMDENFTSNEKTLINNEVKKIQTLYRETQAIYRSASRTKTSSRSKLSISFQIKNYTDFEGVKFSHTWVDVSLTKIKGGIFFIAIEKPTPEDDNWIYYKIKSNIDVALKKMMLMIFDTHKPNHQTSEL